MEVTKINISRIPIAKELILGIQKKQVSSYFNKDSGVKSKERV